MTKYQEMIQRIKEIEAARQQKLEDEKAVADAKFSHAWAAICGSVPTLGRLR